MDEQTSQLDEEYKNGLKIIKQSILNCRNPDYVSSCGLWLQRLEACGRDERSIRNQYLTELCRQMQSGQLEEPFLSPPPPLFHEIPVSVEADGSWSDISTISTATLEIAASGDTYESGGAAVVSDEANMNLNTLAADVEYLKSRLKELVRVKRKLQSSHDAAVAQWERRSRVLEERLNEACRENTRLHSVITSLETKIQTRQTDERQENKLLETHKNEIDELRNRQFQLLKHMEEKHANVLKQKEAEFNAKLEELKLCYETRIATMNATTEGNISSLVTEKERLEALIQEERNRNEQEVVYIKTEMAQGHITGNEAMEEKVIQLQTCIAKMEKLLRKYEKHYTRKINFLKKELRTKDNMLQIQLAAQRAELLAHASSEKHADVENVVSQLECRYRELLDEEHARVLQSDREHSDIIKQLTYKLESL